MASSRPTLESVLAARRTNPIALHRNQSHSAEFSTLPAAENESDVIESDVETDLAQDEPQGKPAARQYRSGSARWVVIPPSQQNPLDRRYSVEQTSNTATEKASCGGTTSDERPPSTDHAHMRLKEIIQRKVVPERLSRSSLLPSPTTSFFGATMAVASSNSLGLNEQEAGQQYEKMMERFQIRRLQHSVSSGSVEVSGGGGGSARSSKVTPRGMPPTSQGTHPRTTPRRSLTSASILAYQHKDVSRCASTGSENSRKSPLPPQAPGLVIKPRGSSTQKRRGAIGNAAAGGAGRFSLHWKMVSLKRKVRHTCQRCVEYLLTPLSPFSGVARVRGVVLLIAFLVHAIYFPMQIAFYPDEAHWLHSVDLATEFVFVLDFLLSFNTSFTNKRGVLVTSRKEIVWNYLKGWCLLDFLAAIPTELILAVGGGEAGRAEWSHILVDGIFRMQRLVHILRIFRMIWMVHVSRSGKSIWAWLLYSRYSHLLRIFWIVALIVLIAHYMACCWKLLDADPLARTHQSPMEQYAENFYAALQLLQGQGLATETIWQSIFASFAVLLGSIVLAIVFGNVAMLVSNFNANSTNYQRKMEAVFAIMSKLQLPAVLRERIHQYYEHLWREYESLDGEIVRFSKELTHNLELEVVLFKYMDLVMNVPFWQDCSPDFQKQIVLHLQVRVYLPDDFILRREEVGDEFHMINRGSCELSTGPDSFEQASAPLHPRAHGSDSTQATDASRYANSGYFSAGKPDLAVDAGAFGKRSRLKTERVSDSDTDPKKRASKYTRLLIRGQAFGEIALLMNYPRTANVRAVTYVEMCVLSRADFQTILTRYPEDRKHTISNILTVCMESNEARQVRCPLKEVVETVFADGDAASADQITARYAASIISSVVNPEHEDESMKFGIGMKLKQQLTQLKEQDEAREGKGDDFSHSATTAEAEVAPTSSTSTATAAPASATEEDPVVLVPPDLEARIHRIETTQSQTLLLLQEMRQAIDELKHVSPVLVQAPGQHEITAVAETQQPPAQMTAVHCPDMQSGQGEPSRHSMDKSKDAPKVGSRNCHSPLHRSSSAPRFRELSQDGAHASANEVDRFKVGAPDPEPKPERTRPAASQSPQKEPDKQQQPAGRFASPSRSVTLRDLNAMETKLAQSITTPTAPIVKRLIASSSVKLRRLSSKLERSESRASRSGSSITRMLLLQRMGALVSFSSSSSGSTTPPQSPTCYADQLFQPRSGGAVSNTFSDHMTEPE